MRNHVWRPLYAALLVVILILAGRTVLVPADFGVHESGYMYGWHRKGNEEEWKKVPVRYRSAAECRGCHAGKYAELNPSPHGGISCENCHGPGLEHPKDPPTLTVDKRRSLCLRCHARLPYPGSGRGKIRGIVPGTHHPELECVTCHYPHDPRREAHR